VLFDLLPIEPIVDTTVRHVGFKLPNEVGFYFFLAYSIYKFERQKKIGKRRDAKDREQDWRLDQIEGKTMEFIKSPNYNKGRFLRSIKYVLVHSMAGNMEPSITAFQRTSREASAHWMIDHNGREVQMVEEGNTAWHAGNWLANTDSIGIETAGGRFPDEHVEWFGDEGMKTLARRIATIHKAYKWGEPSSKTVKAHREVRATACPTGLDMGRVIQMSQDAYNGKLDVVSEPTPNPVVLPAPPPAPVRFTVNLEPSKIYRKSVHDVHNFLVEKGYIKLSPGEYGYYGKKTQAAIHRFQRDNGIIASPKYFGLWYEKTRAAANKLT
jgi:hypothetical protein